MNSTVDWPVLAKVTRDTTQQAFVQISFPSILRSYGQPIFEQFRYFPLFGVHFYLNKYGTAASVTILNIYGLFYTDPKFSLLKIFQTGYLGKLAKY